MKTQRRHCQCCDQETLHDMFTDIWGNGKKSDIFGRALFGIATVGLSEAGAKRARCQRCETVTKV